LFEPVHPRRRPAEQQGLLVRRHARRNALEGIPQHLVAAGSLVHGEVAFEHAAFWAEEVDAGADVRSPGHGQFQGVGWLVAQVEGDDAKAPRDLLVAHQVAEQARVGAGGVQA